MTDAFGRAFSRSRSALRLPPTGAMRAYASVEREALAGLERTLVE